MEVFRISLERWTSKLIASGNAARWNSKGNYAIYTAESRALACLENIVHRSGEGLNDNFKVMVINIPNDISIEIVNLSKLPANWYKFENYPECQEIGDNWLKNGLTSILKVPSAIIHNEFNFIINPNHSESKKIKITKVENFTFDPRIKSRKI